ncbi:MAG: cob(I)yrinic acid a,c-diamide adenosyltransferase [Deltaproteobacteria bacterium]|nr:cob(I)yrinic acid a,c-diamide adenosyltransferase [Deltaproteobacteria bacterium]
MSIVTRQGDRGTTRFFSGEEVSKSHPRLAAYGTLDELVSALGLARSLCAAPAVQGTVHALQLELFQLGTELATPDVANAPMTVEPIAAAHVTALDMIATDLEGEMTLPRAFVIPGSSAGGAALDVARSVCRRLERCIAVLREVEGYDNAEAFRYINRLSDVLFLLARTEEFAAGVDYDTVPRRKDRST